METEAPIMRNLLAKRVLSAWGISKLGTRINAYFEKLINESAIRETTFEDSTVLWKDGLNPDHYEGFRVHTHNGQKRDADDLPPEEIANGIKDILSHQISLPKDDLVREAARLFGFARSGAIVENAMKKGIKIAIQKGFISEKEDRYIIH